MLITTVSDHVYKGESPDPGRLSEIAVPVRSPLICDMYFKAARFSLGRRMEVEVNGEMAGIVEYAKEEGAKHLRIEITPLLTSTDNEIRVRCLLTKQPADNTGDEAVFSLRSDGACAIRKSYRATSVAEPIDQSWKLRLVG